MKIRWFFPLCLLLLAVSCHKTDQKGALTLCFEAQINGGEVDYHSPNYTNEAGNVYQVDEIKYFISAVKFHSVTGEVFEITDCDGIHYFDSNIPSTAFWKVPDALPVGRFDSISFIVGLPPAQNVTGFFVNPPESNMAWPDVLGGGYHYMQINGKWLNENNVLSPFNLHTGIGQLYENGSVVQFVDNSFEVTLPLGDFLITEDGVAQRTLVMNVENWMRSPHTYDFNEWGGAIMQNQEAQRTLRENGHDVFTIRE